MLYIGLDAHQTTSSICILNEEGCRVQRLTVRGFWPKELDAAFENLRTFGAFLVSSRLRGGKVEYVRVISEQGRDCTLQNPWPDRSVELKRGDGTIEKLSGPRFMVKTKKGETLLFR